MSATADSNVRRLHADRDDDAATELRRVGAAVQRRSVTELQRLGAELRDTFGRELREIAMWVTPPPNYLPPPHDVDAERVVLSALLNGERRPSQLQCTAEDFQLGAHCGIFASLAACERSEKLWPAGVKPPIGTIVAALSRYGATERMRAYVLELRDAVPYAWHIRRHAERVRNLAQQRRAIEAMARVDRALRAEVVPSAEDIDGAIQALQQLRGRC